MHASNIHITKQARHHSLIHISPTDPQCNSPHIPGSNQSTVRAQWNNTMDLPTTKQGQTIHKRDYVVHLRARTDLIPILQEWITTLKAKMEFLTMFNPSIILDKIHNHHNTYLMTLSNVSSKMTRTQFADLLIDLRNKGTVIPNNLRINWNSGDLHTEDFHLQGDTQLLKEILLGDKRRRQELQVPAQEPPPTETTRLLDLPLDASEDLLLMEALEQAEKENHPPREQDILAMAVEEINPEDWTTKRLKQTVRSASHRL